MSRKKQEDSPMTLETALEIAMAIALPLWLVVEHLMVARRSAQASRGHLETGRLAGASTKSFAVDNSTGPALLRRAA
jgi:hypothetical protein